MAHRDRMDRFGETARNPKPVEDKGVQLCKVSKGPRGAWYYFPLTDKTDPRNKLWAAAVQLRNAAKRALPLLEAVAAGENAAEGEEYTETAAAVKAALEAAGGL